MLKISFQEEKENNNMLQICFSQEGDSELEATVKMKDSLNATSLPAKPSSFNDCKFQSSLRLLSKCFERSSILEMAHRETKPLNRMIAVLKFILSGFCTIQPESASTDDDPTTVLKPILGEVYRQQSSFFQISTKIFFYFFLEFIKRFSKTSRHKISVMN